ncbi:MAG TPA: trypsin-like peptidase domain-containing protein [bacterium]|nr:trypsin-like peptidase domain-containing protein [bacterium]
MRKYVIVIGIFLWGSLCAAQSSSAALQNQISQGRNTAITRAIAKVSPAVVGVNVTQIRSYTTSPFRDPWLYWFFGESYEQRVENLGSGFLVSADGYILTNAHVVENATEIVITMPGGEKHPGRLIGLDNVTDLALLKIDVKGVRYAQLGNSGEVIIGEWVVALGNPFGLFDISYQPSATLGIVSGLHMDFGQQRGDARYQDMIQTDASINSGNSGGPLVNAEGEVIGINTFIFTGSNYSQGSIGIGFAIPINRAKQIMEDLKTQGRIDWSFYTGLRVQQIDNDIAQAFQLPVNYGIIVTGIEQGSPAAKAGIQMGDIITQAEGQSVRTGRDILNAIQNSYLHAGDVLTLRIWRDGQQRTVKLTLETVR